jgi:hypothetical protein
MRILSLQILGSGLLGFWALEVGRIVSISVSISNNFLIQEMEYSVQNYVTHVS